MNGTTTVFWFGPTVYTPAYVTIGICSYRVLRAWMVNRYHGTRKVQELTLHVCD